MDGSPHEGRRRAGDQSWRPTQPPHTGRERSRAKSHCRRRPGVRGGSADSCPAARPRARALRVPSAPRVPRRALTDTSSGFTPVPTIPPWPGLVRPLLEVLADGQTWRKRDIERAVAVRAGLSPEQLEETLESGQARAFNRIGWATSALRRAKAIEAPERAKFRITDTGQQLLAEHPGPISERVVQAIPAYSEYVPARSRRAASAEPSLPDLDEADPDELISSGIQLIENDTKSTLLQRLKESDPYDFERVVRSLLVKMGYGRDGTMSPLRGSGDGGPDGVIDRDELGQQDLRAGQALRRGRDRPSESAGVRRRTRDPRRQRGRVLHNQPLQRRGCRRRRPRAAGDRAR
ncbi:hypothetical protein F6J84_09795 [Microbacterium caowuchunii]|nr:hypothetical protein F6J84_09795 [Microbacterium caowuchunii]